MFSFESEATISTASDKKGVRPVWLGPDLGKWDHARVHVQVIQDERLTPNDKLVYLGLVMHADTVTGLCWPSIPTLADYIKSKERTVQRSLQALEDAGYVEVERRRGKSNRYYLLEVIHTDATLALLPSDQRHTGVRYGQVGATSDATVAYELDELTRSKEGEPRGIDNFCHDCGFYRDPSYPVVSQCKCK